MRECVWLKDVDIKTPEPVFHLINISNIEEVIYSREHEMLTLRLTSGKEIQRRATPEKWKHYQSLLGDMRYT